MPEFIASLQTYEGGFGNASFPDWAFSNGTCLRYVFPLMSAEGPLSDGYDPAAPRPVLGEAHGGYTFCALASWVFLQPYIRTHYKSPFAKAPYTDRVSPTINMRSLLRWLTHMQGTEVELGGFKGRTNKLVDGCYSWWAGGCFPLVDALLGEGAAPTTATQVENIQTEDNEWHDVDGKLTTQPKILCSVYDGRALWHA